MLDVQFKKLDNFKDDVQLPQHQTPGAAGMDICACVDDSVNLKAGQVVMIPTGLAFQIPIGYECQVRSRSGLAAKNGIFALNSPGTIDSDYRGEVKIILANFSQKDFEIKNGDRIAQLVFAKYEQVNFNQVENLDETQRSSGGFGSTGV